MTLKLRKTHITVLGHLDFYIKLNARNLDSKLWVKSVHRSSVWVPTCVFGKCKVHGWSTRLVALFLLMDDMFIGIINQCDLDGYKIIVGSGK